MSSKLVLKVIRIRIVSYTAQFTSYHCSNSYCTQKFISHSYLLILVYPIQLFTSNIKSNDDNCANGDFLGILILASYVAKNTQEIAINTISYHHYFNTHTHMIFYYLLLAVW